MPSIFITIKKADAYAPAFKLFTNELVIKPQQLQELH